MKTASFLLAAVATATTVLAGPNCPPLGPVYEKPYRFKDSAAMQSAIANLTAVFQALDQNNSPAMRANTTSYSIEVFSTSEEEPLIFSWHHTAAALREAKNNSGVRETSADAVYRLGSLTKVFTVYTWLVQDGDVKWNEPITKYVPELAAAADSARDDPVAHVPWDEVTIGALAGQLSGAIRDYGLMSEVTQEFNQSDAVQLGFPPLEPSDPMLPKCGQWPQCNRTEFFKGLLRAYPSFAPFATPAYTNTGYQILAYALESIKGKSFQTLMEESVLRPLGLNHTYFQKAPAEVGIIPGTRKGANWDYQLGDENPAGNMYSSVADISALGRAIMRSTLLPPVLTRRWLRPASMSSELVAGVGYPWGVRRVVVPYANGKHVVDAFNKAGSIGYYSSLLVLLPDYDAGFSVLIAGPQTPGNTNFNLADLLGTRLVPALEAAAREHADAKFGGEYVDETGTASLRLTTQPDRPGLGVENWVRNGTNMGYIAVVLQGGYSPVNASVRLYPAGLETVREDGSKRVAFKAVFEDLNQPARPDSMFSTDCGTWVAFTGVVYGTQPLDQFIFEIDAEGKVVSIENLALRAVMKKR
ncbi:D-alanyl-D-alanine-carboxypeptidase/endopeptidase AmpH [Corynascus novoguineensis]|uniref:D-alanyl-D-alanine-carboxypeptidase/endopeptidase AmpH n=1 Tax=Corynascus novoguineensis TaxID=1126955 RepID=A0AAN7CVB8_9PEZI|nr:D-alanyl-D-alanine-carboxypeptidase/endopeptidase AmpH [Corynascus novoguineensis]